MKTLFDLIENEDKMQEEDNFLTLKQVAGVLNITWQTVRNYIKNGELGAIMLSGDRNYRISPAELNRFIKNRKSNEVIGAAGVNVYHKNTKNCTLMFEGKMDLASHIKKLAKIEFEEISKEHEFKLLNSIYFGDNLLVMNKLLEEFRGKIDLVYIDPPFGTDQDFIAYDGHTGYSDKITNEEFLEFLRKRLYLIRELMSDEGSIYLHIDKKMGHYVKIIMDEIFGEANYINEITRIKCNPKNFARKAYGNYTDTIFFYGKNRDLVIWNDLAVDLNEEEIVRLFPKKDAKGRRYTTHPLHAPGETKDGATGREWNGMMPPIGRHWRYHPDVLTKLFEDNLIEVSTTGNRRKIVFADEHTGKKAQDIWEFKDKGKKYSDYPTEKNNDMLEFIVKNSSNEGSIVLDCFSGSFATVAIAGQNSRKFLGIDVNIKSIEVGCEKLKKNKVKFNYYKIKESTE